MKKFAMGFISALLCICAVSCTTVHATDKERIVITSTSAPSSLHKAIVFEDTETGVEYLVVTSANGTAITPMYYSDGVLKISGEEGK